MTITTEKTIRVFVIDDYPLVRIGLRYDLAPHPDIDMIGEAADAEAGIEAVKQLKPDIVIMDLGLPGMNGIDAAREIKQFDDSIKVLALTSHDQEEKVVSAIGSGINGYCLKDTPSERMPDIIRAVANGCLWLDSAVAGVASQLFESEKNTRHIMTVKANGNYNLTQREEEVLKLLVNGCNNNEIAEAMAVSAHTVKTYMGNIFQKLSVTDRVQAAIKALKENIV